MTTDTVSTPDPIRFSNVADLATVTKAPVQSVFDSLATTGSLEADVFNAHPDTKPGSVKAALKLLFDNGLVAKRNNVSGRKGRPQIRYFRLADAPEIAPKPVKVPRAPKSPAPESVETQPVDASDPSTGSVLVEITG